MVMATPVHTFHPPNCAQLDSSQAVVAVEKGCPFQRSTSSVKRTNGTNDCSRACHWVDHVTSELPTTTLTVYFEYTPGSRFHCNVGKWKWKRATPHVELGAVVVLQYSTVQHKRLNNLNQIPYYIFILSF